MSETSEIRAHFAEQVASVGQLYGFGSKFGRLYAHLFLSPDPMSLSQLAERSGLAKSTCSGAMRSLERFRMVRRLPRGSDRQDYYEAESDPTRIIQDLARNFLGPELALGGEMLRGLESGIDALAVEEGLGDAGRTRLRSRVEDLERGLEDGRALLDFVMNLGATHGSGPTAASTSLAKPSLSRSSKSRHPDRRAEGKSHDES